MKSILRNKHLITLGIAETVSGVGNWITMMAVFSILIFRGGGDVWQSSGIMLAGLLPVLVCSPLAGKLADRASKKYIMIASQLLSAGVILTIFLTQNPGLLLLLVAVLSALGAVMSPARQSLIPLLVTDPDELTRANAFLQQLASLVKIGSPMLAGLLITLMGPYNAMIFDMLSFIIAAGILLLLPNVHAIPATPIASTVSEYTPAIIAEQKPLTVIRQSSQLRLLFATLFLTVISVIGFDILGSIYTRDFLQGDEGFFGLLIGAVGLGTVLSGFHLMLRKKQVNPWLDMQLGLFLMIFLPGFLILATLFSGDLLKNILALGGTVIGGAGVGFLVIQSATILQTQSPVGVLGRISGYYQATMVAGQIVSIIGVPMLVPTWLGIIPFLGWVMVSLGCVLVYMVVSFNGLQRQALAGANTP